MGHVMRPEAAPESCLLVAFCEPPQSRLEHTVQALYSYMLVIVGLTRLF